MNLLEIIADALRYPDGAEERIRSMCDPEIVPHVLACLDVGARIAYSDIGHETIIYIGDDDGTGS